MPMGAAIVAFLLAAGDLQPARLVRGDAPRPAPQTLGWETAVLRVHVSARGTSDAIETVGGAEPLASGLRRMVDHWLFEPAMDGKKAIASPVLIAAVYRPRTLHDVPAFGGISIAPAAQPDQIPVPTSASPPRYPPTAVGDGVVIVEVLVGLQGEVRSAAVVRSTASGFNGAAIGAASTWHFRPATRQGRPVPAYAYLVFGFRQPVTTPRARGARRITVVDAGISSRDEP